MQEPTPIPLPALADNYIWLLPGADGNAVAVDPGEAAPVLRALQAGGLRLEAILLTHHHADHTGGVAELVRATGAHAYAPTDQRIPAASHRVADGDRVHHPATGFDFEVLAVPGHTRSHVAWYGHGLLFPGDTLFSVGCGRLFEGTAAQMHRSLQRLAALPGETLVCPAHEYTAGNCAFALTVEPGNEALQERAAEATRLRAQGKATLPVSLARELATNPFLRLGQPALLAALGGDDAGARLAELRARKDRFRVPAA